MVQETISLVKSQGVFDQFRKDCLADVDTKVDLAFLLYTCNVRSCSNDHTHTYTHTHNLETPKHLQTDKNKALHEISENRQPKKKPTVLLLL